MLWEDPEMITFPWNILHIKKIYWINIVIELFKGASPSCYAYCLCTSFFIVFGTWNQYWIWVTSYYFAKCLNKYSLFSFGMGFSLLSLLKSEWFLLDNNIPQIGFFIFSWYTVGKASQEEILSRNFILLCA